MKYTILINQAGAVQAGLVGKVDLVQLAILEWLYDWSVSPKSKMKTLTYEGRTFYWMDYKNMMKELPILGITSPTTAWRYTNKLCDAGLLVRYPNNTKERKAYFAFGDVYNNFLKRTPQDEKNIFTSERDILEPSTSKPKDDSNNERLTTSKVEDYSTTNNYTTNNISLRDMRPTADASAPGTSSSSNSKAAAKPKEKKSKEKSAVQTDQFESKAEAVTDIVKKAMAGAWSKWNEENSAVAIELKDFPKGYWVAFQKLAQHFVNMAAGVLEQTYGSKQDIPKERLIEYTVDYLWKEKFLGRWNELSGHWTCDMTDPQKMLKHLSVILANLKRKKIADEEKQEAERKKYEKYQN